MSVSKVCIQTDHNGDPVAIDVVLPSGARVGELLPTIVGLVVDRAVPGDSVRNWRLQRPSGDRLDQSLSLIDNGIRDGELLILGAEPVPTLGPLRRTAYQEVSVSQPSDCHVSRFLPGVVCVLATVAAATALAWTAGSEGATTHAIIAAVGATAAAVMAVAAGYPTASNIAVVSLACATGFLAVPSAPAAPNVFLAAAAALSTSLLMLRLSGRVSPALTAIAVLALLTASVTLVALPTVVVGAALSTASLTLLALSPRLAVLAAGLGPDHWRGGVATSALTGHATLSGLVAGCAAGVASGGVVVAVANHANDADAASAAFTGLIGTVLLLRCRTYADSDRHIAMAAGGLVTLIACLHVLLSTRAESVGPVACVLVVVGLVAIRRPRCGSALSRMLDRLEYAALAAVVPVACWVGGAYDAVGGFGLR